MLVAVVVRLGLAQKDKCGRGAVVVALGARSTALLVEGGRVLLVE